MSDLDAALGLTQPEPVTSVSTTTVRRCMHPTRMDMGDGRVTCTRCGRPIDPVLSRRGRSSRRLGNDQERRAERRYGWEKIGERGEKTDLRGTFAKVQQKATRKAPPSLFRDTFAGLDATKDGRVPLLLLTYVQQGRPTEDFVVMRGEDWLALHGVDGPDPEDGDGR